MSSNGLREVIKRLREAQGLTQVDLAAAAKVERSYVVKLESGDKANPSLAVLQRLAGALDVPLARLTAYMPSGQRLKRRRSGMDERLRQRLDAFVGLLNRSTPHPLDRRRFYDSVIYAFEHGAPPAEVVRATLRDAGLDREEAHKWAIRYEDGLGLLRRLHEGPQVVPSVRRRP